MDKQSARPMDLAQQTAESVPKEFQEPFTKVVKAGMKIMFSEQTHDAMLDELQQEGDLADRIGSALADLMVFMYVKSNKTMPTEVIIPAATYLLSEGADFLEKVTGEEISADILANGMDIMIKKLMSRFGIDPNKYAQAFEGAAQQQPKQAPMTEGGA